MQTGRARHLGFGRIVMGLVQGRFPRPATTGLGLPEGSPRRRARPSCATPSIRRVSIDARPNTGGQSQSGCSGGTSCEFTQIHAVAPVIRGVFECAERSGRDDHREDHRPFRGRGQSPPGTVAQLRDRQLFRFRMAGSDHQSRALVASGATPAGQQEPVGFLVRAWAGFCERAGIRSVLTKCMGPRGSGRRWTRSSPGSTITTAGFTRGPTCSVLPNCAPLAMTTALRHISDPEALAAIETSTGNAPPEVRKPWLA